MSLGPITCPAVMALASTQYLSPLFENVEMKKADAKAAIIKVIASGMRALIELFLFFITVPKALLTQKQRRYPQSVKGMS